ncbi:hypothetical protein AK812_SmicGene17307 [Symbiodinium microadriaticum]|uniref:Uncharacterized protein n=1 Tax=Symbiodinium microadriaticum TaxID=2951 RepID=A0A1Q9DY44_SYMMI|nr:hypothetical protein AK812_SmicGene17307 [Symbiodinium microadriaticum]CAE7759862.1 unnamed protein product [Symbiodinium sp. KB8]
MGLRAGVLAKKAAIASPHFDFRTGPLVFGEHMLMPAGDHQNLLKPPSSSRYTDLKAMVFLRAVELGFDLLPAPCQGNDDRRASAVTSNSGQTDLCTGATPQCRISWTEHKSQGRVAGRSGNRSESVVQLLQICDSSLDRSPSESGCSGASALHSMQPVTSRLLEPEAVPVQGVLKPRGRSYEEVREKAVVARRTLRTTVLAAELLHLSICAALLTSEALAAAIANDGMLFRGSHGFEEAVSMSLLALSPILSAVATAVLCCRDLAVDPGLSPAFALLALFAAAEACFLAVSSAGTDRAMHAFGWPLELLVALGRSGAALAAGRPRTEAPAQEPRASPRPVGTRTKRRLPPTEAPPSSEGAFASEVKHSVTPVTEETLALPVQSCALLDFEELDYQSASPEEWKQKLLEQLRATLGITEEACSRFHLDFRNGAAGSLLAEIRAPETALQSLLKANKPLVLSHCGVVAAALPTGPNRAQEGLHHSHCAAARVVMASVRTWQRQLHMEMEDLRNKCQQRFQEIEENYTSFSNRSQEQHSRLKSLEAKAQLSLYRPALTALTDSVEVAGHPRSPEQHPAPFPQAQAVEAGAEAAAASVARRVTERVRQDLEAEMETLRHRFLQVVRDVEDLHRSAAIGRAQAAEASAASLRQLLVEALIRPGRPDEAQQLALKLLSQALNAATLLSAASLSPEPSSPIAEIFKKHESAVETRKICEDILAERIQDLLADGHGARGAIASALGKMESSASSAALPRSQQAVLPPPPRSTSEPRKPGAAFRPMRLAALGRDTQRAGSARGEGHAL